MSFLELKNIGKIYVSDNNVSVGIRNVDLSFERGEFVAVTGKSGSGKSTLLNVISGMDTYEEGELLVNGEPTSHYQQKDWEEYRKEYISFIFQDYNILESFTVLQNVELALMNIEDTKKRREKALELIKRVGLEKHVNHKGSKLSGGQKQRTVIARALAKDSPVILADEPTGNLDSETSKEIIELLREVSHDKLVIVVTHNFDQVEKYATRHIRVFNGEIESDQTVTSPETVQTSGGNVSDEPKKRFSTLKNGFILGKVRFAATPKLSVFLFLLLTVTTLVMALITSESADAKGLFEDDTVFRHTEGRAVVVRKDGRVPTADDVKTISDTFGKEVVRYDYLYDAVMYSVPISEVENGRMLTYNDYYAYDRDDFDVFYYDFDFERVKSGMTVDVGRLPEKANEVSLRVPINAKPLIEKNGFREWQMSIYTGDVPYTVTGVKYFYDNTKTSTFILTDEGFRVASLLCCVMNEYGSFDVFSGEAKLPTYYNWDIGQNEYYAKCSGKVHAAYDIRMNSGAGTISSASSDLGDCVRLDKLGDNVKEKIFIEFIETDEFAVVSPYIVYRLMERDIFPDIYTQMSVLFADDDEVRNAGDTFASMGYFSVATDETRDADIGDRILSIFVLGWLVVMWILGVVFAAMLLSLCSSHAMNSVKGDIAVMRSMGIPTRVIKISIYVQTLLALIPAFIVTVCILTAVYVIPRTNGIFAFMHVGDYLLIAVIVIAITLRLSRKFVNKMFGDSVKKTLKGGVKG